MITSILIYNIIIYLFYGMYKFNLIKFYWYLNKIKSTIYSEVLIYINYYNLFIKFTSKNEFYEKYA